MKYRGEEFLLKIYKDLVNSELVKNSGKGGNKYEDVNAYMGRLERITQKGLEHDDLRILKQFYYAKYIIKPENIPDAHFKHQEQIALDRGYGHVHYTDEIKQKEIEQIINEQKASLDTWIEYFASPDTEMYPTWFKYYCFQGMVRLGYFDKQSEKYTKRTDTTTKPFIELNREALAMIYDELIKVLNKQDVDDKKLEELLKNGSFSKIYAYCIKKLDSIKKSKSNSDEGIWKKYLQNSDSNILFNDIHGKGTGWCTAGGLETATQHLNGGDFYVYFTKDENGEYTCPRIAIRMEHNQIAEIRGIAQDQNLESNMEKIVEEKLEEFPDKEKYKKKCKDMKMLTYIYTKWKNNKYLELNKDELVFLYEIEEKIIGFGFKKDSRIKEILDTRNITKDLSYIFNCKEEQISTTNEEALKKNIICHYGNIELENTTSAENIAFPKIINGSVILKKLQNAKNIKFPEIMNGNIELNNLIEVEELELPNKKANNIYLNNLTSFKKLKLPIEVGALYLNKLTSAEGIKLPKIITSTLNLKSLTNADGLEFPERIDQTLYLDSLPVANNLKLPKIVGDLFLNNLTDVNNIEFPEIIKRNLNLKALVNVEKLKLPKEIGQSLELNSLTTIKELELPKKIGGPLHLNSLKSINNLEIPENIRIAIYLNSLETVGILKFSKIINGSIYLNKLKKFKELKLPEQVSGSLHLDSITNLNNLKLPDIIEDNLNLNGLETVEKLNLPKTINGDVWLNKLKEFKELKLPEKINGTLWLGHITSTEGLIIPDELDCKIICPLANNDINILKQMCKENNKTK